MPEVYTEKTASDENILKKKGYVLNKVLGEGSYAKVYLAEFLDEKNGKKQKLACKVIDGSSAPKDFLKKFFLREVQIMSMVNHPNLIRVHSILQRRLRYFLFMQFAENGDLLDFIRANGAIREKQARIWFCQLAKGLKYLHDKDVAHRDLKCENLLLTATYNVKISDFGFARKWKIGDQKSETFCGSVSYACPEIIRGVPYDPKKADLWSIGIILFIMLNKSMPFDDSSLKKLYVSQMTRAWKFRDKVKGALSMDVKTIIYTMLEPNSEKRLGLDKLWLEPWIQRASNTQLNSSGQSVPPETAEPKSSTAFEQSRPIA